MYRVDNLIEWMQILISAHLNPRANIG